MLTVINLDESEKWDSIVKSFSNYDVYWLSGYVKAFKLHGDGDPLLFYYENTQKNEINLRGINVVFKRDISNISVFSDKIEKNTLFDFITPYGYGGWIIEGNGHYDLLFNEYDNWCRKNNIVSEFVRYHPVIDNQKYSVNNYEVIPLGGTISIDLTNRDLIWNNFTSKNRNVIRKAQKSGVRIYNGRYPEIFSKFKNLYDATMDKDEADKYYYFKNDFYDSILNDLPTESQIFFAVYEDKIIAASIILASNGKLNYHLSGSDRNYQHLAPTNLLLYKAALWGADNGCKTFHLGGGVGSQEDNLYKFKASFYKGEPCQFCIGKKVFDKEKYDELVRISGKSTKSFFPEYRG